MRSFCLITFIFSTLIYYYEKDRLAVHIFDIKKDTKTCIMLKQWISTCWKAVIFYQSKEQTLLRETKLCYIHTLKWDCSSENKKTKIAQVKSKETKFIFVVDYFVKIYIDSFLLFLQLIIYTKKKICLLF